MNPSVLKRGRDSVFFFLCRHLTAIAAVKRALQEEIEQAAVNVQDCPQIAFKPIEAQFGAAPRKFQVELIQVPEFPIEVFPEKISNYLSLVSAQYSQISDYAATCFIGAIAGIIGRSIHLKMRPTDSWQEPANCWCILVGPPSAKKSPIMRRIFNLFTPFENKAAEEFFVANKAYQLKKKTVEKNKENFDEMAPIRRRYITDDVTTPKLRELMSGNPRGIILRNDELKGQLERLDKMGNEGDRSFMMSCWSGLESYSEDRMCEGRRLQNISRYETTIERNFYRSFKELREIKSIRQIAEQKKNDPFGFGFV